MKISPIEIKQKKFTLKTFGKGFDREEVAAFLALLSQDWEMLQEENREQKIKIELLEKEVGKLREVETSLFRTLKTAEDTSTNIIDQARKTAELKVREAQIKADVVLNDARTQARSIVQKAQLRARQALEEMVQEIKKHERDYQDLQLYKDNFLLDLKMFMNEAVEKVSKFESKNPNRYFEEKIKEAQESLEEKNELIDEQDYFIERDADTFETSTSNINENTVTYDFGTTTAEDDANKEVSTNSFFDTLNN
jgi:cell division initiation protein